MDLLKTKLEELSVSEKAKLTTYVSYDDEHLILEMDYLNGKFIMEKTFPNNYKGVEQIEELKQLYKTEYDVKRYFNLE